MSNILTPEIANQYATRAMMCSRAYIHGTDRTPFPVEELGWRKVDLEGEQVLDGRNSYTPHSLAGKVLSSLQFDIWESTEADESIVCFKGTDEATDWITGNAALGISIPYKSAKRKVLEYKTRFPERRLSLAGHSLGGGLALSVSVWLGIDALVFNSSPRIFDGWKNMNEPATRRAVFQKGDVLQILRDRWPKFLEKVPSANVVETQFDYRGESQHRIDLLAEGLLRTATDPLLVSIADSLPVKVGV